MSENATETEPLIPVDSQNEGVDPTANGAQSVRPLPLTRTDTESVMNALDDATMPKEKGKRHGDSIGVALGIGSLLVMWIFTLILVLRSDPKSLRYFALHPPAQVLAINLFTIGILTLQPTRRLKHKKEGLLRHQIIQLGLGLSVILFGGIAMFINKVEHGAPHFTTWHGRFGLIALIWLVLHSLVGGASVWFPVKAFGSVDKGKMTWKWHRVSGYLLVAWFLITAHLAGGYATWVQMETSWAERFWIYTILPIIALIGIASRIRIWKLPGFQKPDYSVGIVS